MDQDRITHPDMPTDPLAVDPAPVRPSPVGAAARPANQAPSRGSRLVNVALGGALVVAIGGAAFAVGRGTAPAATPTGVLSGLGAGGQVPNASFVPGGGLGRGFAGGLSVEGTVVSVDAGTLEVETADGQTVEITLGSDTEYHAQSTATADDVTAGSEVIVRLGAGGLGGQDGPRSSAAPGVDGATASDVTIVP
jgi:hypothetical protein